MEGNLWCVGAFGDRNGSVAMLVHKHVIASLGGFHTIGGRVAYADSSGTSGVWRAITAHLPHTGHSEMEFEASREILREALPRCRKTRKSRLELTQMQDDPECIGQFGLGVWSARGYFFLAWIQEKRFTSANTFFHEDTWTRKTWSNGAKRQIDHVLIHTCFRTELQNAKALPEFMQATDHRAVWTKQGRSNKAQGTSLQRKGGSGS